MSPSCTPRKLPFCASVLPITPDTIAIPKIAIAAQISFFAVSLSLNIIGDRRTTIVGCILKQSIAIPMVV